MEIEAIVSPLSALACPEPQTAYYQFSQRARLVVAMKNIMAQNPAACERLVETGSIDWVLLLAQHH